MIHLPASLKIILSLIILSEICSCGGNGLKSLRRMGIFEASRFYAGTGRVPRLIIDGLLVVREWIMDG